MAFGTMQDGPFEPAVVAKVYRRLVWFLVLLFVCSYLDRINMSFAALSMNKDLGLTATTFGLASSIFYVAYVIAEIPSNMMMPRFGAKIWIPRIMITWGIVSSATLFATGPYSLYALRALVGLAEAGFMPGILLFMTYWFPPSHRARASTLFIMAQPITIMFGSFLSGALLELNGTFGLAGWQWLFLLEGLPSIALGVIAYFYLDNKPADAVWLSATEKEVLTRALEGQQAAASGIVRPVYQSVARELASAPLILLALVYFCLTASLSSNSAWVPQIVRSVVPHGSYFFIGVIAAIPSLVSICVMPFWGRSSDRRQERTWHVVLPLLLAAAGWTAVALSNRPIVQFAGLIGCSVGGFAAQSIFWTLPATYVSQRSRPIGIAVVNTVGMLGTTLTLTVVGWLRDLTSNFSAGLLFVTACMLIASLLVAILPHVFVAAAKRDVSATPTFF